MKKIGILDLFAGAGGMSTGFEMENFNSLIAVEKDAAASATYKHNHEGTFVINEDITKITMSDFKGIQDRIKGIIGGPPCQGFSLSGTRDKKDPRNSLFMEFVRLVSDIKPDFFVMENVSGILSMKNSRGVLVKEIILKEYEKIGYKIAIKKLNAANYGVPQKRVRVFFIGIPVNFDINPEDINPDVTNLPDEYITIQEAIGNITEISEKYSAKKQTKYQKNIRNNSKEIRNHIPMRHTQRIIERFKTIKEGQSLKDVPQEHMMRKRGDANKISGKTFSQNNMRPFWNKPSPTIAASFQGNFIHPKLNRNYTAREAARLQSFPDTYEFLGKRTKMSWEKDLSQYQQIGNAVPPLMAKAIAKKIYELLYKNKK